MITGVSLNEIEQECWSMTAMNESKVSAFGGSVYDDSVDHDANNQTVDEFLAAVLGPRQVPMGFLVPVTLFYVAVFVTGLLGNIAVCGVIARSRLLHSAMNYYLISLAVSDLFIIILGVPNEVMFYWQQYPYIFGESFCKFRAFASEIASYASVLTIVSFSVERYLAICHPLYVWPLPDLPRAILVSTLCWLVATVAAVPYFISTRIHYLDFPWGSGQFVPGSAFCAMLDGNIQPKGLPIYEVAFVVFFLVPIIVLTVLYILMAVAIRKTRISTLRGSVHGGHSNDNKKQIIRMLAAVVVLFFISWLPFHIQRLGYVYFKESFTFRIINEYLFYISGFLYFLSSTLNPVLYNLMSAKYRKVFKSTFDCSNSSTGALTRDRIRTGTWGDPWASGYRSSRFGTTSAGPSAATSLRSINLLNSGIYELREISPSRSQRNSCHGDRGLYIQDCNKNSKIFLSQNGLNETSLCDPVGDCNGLVRKNSCYSNQLQVPTFNKNICVSMSNNMSSL